MKKYFLIVLLIVGCGKNNDTDAALNGTWVSKGTATASTSVHESYVMHFDGNSLTINRTRDSDVMSSQREVASGTYQVEDHVAEFKVEKHSCAKLMDEGVVVRSVDSKFSYQIGSDASEMQVNFGPNKIITFRKVLSSDEDTIINILDSAVTGCFVEGTDGKITFQKGSVEKPKSTLQVVSQ